MGCGRHLLTDPTCYSCNAARTRRATEASNAMASEQLAEAQHQSALMEMQLEEARAFQNEQLEMQRKFQWKQWLGGPDGAIYRDWLAAAQRTVQQVQIAETAWSNSWVQATNEYIEADKVEWRSRNPGLAEEIDNLYKKKAELEKERDDLDGVTYTEEELRENEKNRKDGNLGCLIFVAGLVVAILTFFLLPLWLEVGFWVRFWAAIGILAVVTIAAVIKGGGSDKKASDEYRKDQLKKELPKVESKITEAKRREYEFRSIRSVEALSKILGEGLQGSLPWAAESISADIIQSKISEFEEWAYVNYPEPRQLPEIFYPSVRNTKDDYPLPVKRVLVQIRDRQF